ncbi:hypothetical protein P280DRAFT_490518 [Massarina eburnea CBS 473.64]|uniref:Ornithine decarboxylase antizyme n=1 Tax=Massarina eburnea CBS 473.64 TaxID=1395130 RepID=A0A6A6RX70_9PLEO|nr:hypothetical protein P280DRAFT_490518 [Massarina eburnea CBS 473.64]
MANSSSKRSSSSSSNRSTASSTANVRASAYSVNASTAMLKGFHYSTTGAGGAECPPLAARHTSSVSKAGGQARRGGAAYTIKEECERLFCETLSSVFLGEGNLVRQDSLVTGMHSINLSAGNDYGVDVGSADRIMDSPPALAVSDIDHVGKEDGDMVKEWIEVWDYVGGVRFRGFVVEKEQEKTLFVFFDKNVIGAKIKAGLMALLELCDVDYFSCSRLVLAIDRQTEKPTMDSLVKDLGWIGLRLATLNDFADQEEIVSDQWLFMGMET